jgi:hypothetical protein
MNLTPVWLLDVDGVLNVPRPGWGAAPHRARAYSDGIEYAMRWSPRLLDRIRSMHQSGRVEIRWCTTWCPAAHELERIFRLPALPRALDVDPVPTGSAGDDLKLAVAREVLATGRRLVWTDDTAVPDVGPLHDELADGGRALLIRPTPRVGLQPKHLDAVEAFLAHPAAE